MRLTKEDVEVQKELIIRRAFEVFAEKGFEATKMGDIAEAANISRNPLYYHFTNKTQLFLAVYDDYCRRYYEKSIAVYNKKIGYFDKIKEGINAYSKDHNLKGNRLRNDVLSNIPGLEAALEQQNRLFERLYLHKLEITKEAIIAGVLRSDCDPYQVADLIIVFYTGLYGSARSFARETDEGHSKRLVDAFIDCLQVKYGC